MVNAQRLISLLTAAGYTPRRYSGRGMMGRECVGVTAEPWQLARKLGSTEVDEPHMDALGFGHVLYWPNVEWPKEEEPPKRFDAYEVKPVVETPLVMGVRHCEAFDTLAEAQEAREADTEHDTKVFWSLFGHRDGEGVECIGDFDSEQAAFNILYSITGIKGVSGKTVYMLTESRAPLTWNNSIEVYFDLVSDCYHMVGKGEIEMELLGGDSRERGRVLVEWANEFETIHANTDWSEKVYFEEQEEFLTKKIQELKQ